MKKRILVGFLLVMGSFTGGLAISKYRPSSAATINYTLTEYNEDGTIAASSKVLRVSNTREWSQTQVLPNGQLKTTSGKLGENGLKYPPDSPRAEILGRPVVIVFDRSTEVWYDPALRDFLKQVLYTDESRQKVRAVLEAVEVRN